MIFLLPTLLLLFIHSIPSALNIITSSQHCSLPSYTYSLQIQLGSHFQKKKWKKEIFPDFLLLSSTSWVNCPPTCFHSTRSTASLQMLLLSGKTVSPAELVPSGQERHSVYYEIPSSWYFSCFTRPHYHSGCSISYE